MTRVAVVGHVEWMRFARVDRVPVAGEIIHALESWEEPGGGGAVASVQLARLAGECLLLTALGDDEVGHRAEAALRDLGVRVEAVFRPEPQRQGFVYLDSAAERTITVMGDRLGPRAADPLPWDELDDVDAVYFTAGDPAAVRQARRARTLVGTPRGVVALAKAGVQLDALVSSARDEGERYEPGDIEPPPRLVVRTEGSAGGSFETAEGRSGRWEAVPLEGPPQDSYGAGDSFAAGLTYGLGSGMSPEEAVRLGARLGAASIAARGPYGRPL